MLRFSNTGDAFAAFNGTAEHAAVTTHYWAISVTSHVIGGNVQ